MVFKVESYVGLLAGKSIPAPQIVLDRRLPCRSEMINRTRERPFDPVEERRLSETVRTMNLDSAVSPLPEG